MVASATPLFRFMAVVVICVAAVYIRLMAVIVYGRVIHEFDPWFNFRATQYLVDNGYQKFSEWYDDMSWSPIGRPVGTTVYPGMMLTASSIYYLFEFLGLGISLNDICVFIPAGFGLLSSIYVGGIGYECSDLNVDAGLLSAFTMAIIPAHLMRSVAGGYDNESVAISAICGTFYFWVRSLRSHSSWPFAIPAALSYAYMAATWGAYTFVINMVGVHAGVLLLMGRYSKKAYLSYSIFYALGTFGSIQVPIIGLAPFQSLELMGPLAVFAAYQALFVLDFVCDSLKIHPNERGYIRYQILALGGAFVFFLGSSLLDSGQIWDLSVRVRALFIKHTKTGNPLVDSVAEHRATSTRAYTTYFHVVMFLIPPGVIRCLQNTTDAKLFQVLFVVVSAYFSTKMVRLILMLAPAASVCSGIALEAALSWTIPIMLKNMEDDPGVEPTPATHADQSVDTPSTSAKQAKSTSDNQQPKASTSTSTLKQRNKKADAAGVGSSNIKTTKAPVEKAAKKEIDNRSPLQQFLHELKENPEQEHTIAMVVLGFICLFGVGFIQHSFTLSKHLSEPQIIMRTQGQNGQAVILDDFREAYWYLRDETPEDARVMAWWDYGYQITGIGNRTSLADGNTWNHEHIALLGRCLVTPEEESHKITRHLADYVLVWSTRYAGIWGDDVAKMPHMARIAGSVYPNINPDEFYMSRDKDRIPSETMKASLLFQLHSYRLDDSVPEPKHFTEVFTTTHDMVRIYKVNNVDEESKKHPFGAYPPALKDILAEAQAFKQS